MDNNAATIAEVQPWYDTELTAVHFFYEYRQKNASHVRIGYKNQLHFVLMKYTITEYNIFLQKPQNC